MASTRRNSKKADWKDCLMFRSIVLGRMTTVFRNLADEKFTERMSDDERVAVREKLLSNFTTRPYMFKEKPDVLTQDDSFSASLISIKRRDGLLPLSTREYRDTLAVIHSRQKVCCLGGEDHLVLSCVEPMSYAKQWDALQGYLERLEKNVRFARHPQYGYLSPNPAHVGTGLRLSMNLCLMGLTFTKELDRVLRGIEQLGLEVSPMYRLAHTEGFTFDAPGCCYCISTLPTLAYETDSIARMERLCSEIARQEQNARLRLIETDPLIVLDHIRRFIAVGSVAELISEVEAIDIAMSFRYFHELQPNEKPDFDVEFQLDSLIFETGSDRQRQMFRARGLKEFPDEKAFRASQIRSVALRLLPLCLEDFGDLEDVDL